MIVQSWVDPQLVDAAADVIANAREVWPQSHRRHIDAITLWAPPGHRAEPTSRVVRWNNRIAKASSSRLIARLTLYFGMPKALPASEKLWSKATWWNALMRSLRSIIGSHCFKRRYNKSIQRIDPNPSLPV